jgi:hypothetical protein
MAAAGVSTQGLQLAEVASDRLLFAAGPGVTDLQDSLGESKNFVSDRPAGGFHPGMADWGYREDRLRNSLQIGGGPQGAFVDIDFFNPRNGLAGAIGHAVELLQNKLSNNKTDPFKVGKALGYHITGYVCP